MSGPLAYGQANVTQPLVSESACPAEVISITGKEGHQITAVLRKPPGSGRFPAVVFLHGGLNARPLETLKKESLSQPTHTRFLAAGYVTVNATFRSRQKDPQTRDALEDCLVIIAQVKKMPDVNPKAVVVMGGSGGGSLALELAGETDLCAVVAGEPASVLFTGMMKTEGRAELEKMMDDPKRFYSAELQKFTREKIAKIRCPVLIAHGDKHPINKINHEIVIPEMHAAKKPLEVIHYPGQPHGFYYGRNGDPEAGQKFFNDAQAFFKRHLPTRPTPLDESLVKQVPVGPK
ncbi:MAG: dienelactone hydrolase family protein [Verrucomicrobiota bacterium]|nr:dienelactone hydrolase family protein [Verrucomicrobiota bacterium]